MPMNPEIKAKWVAALRSGEYKQTTGVLTEVNDDGTTSHCCLGVLCELALQDGLGLEVTTAEDQLVFATHPSESDRRTTVHSYDGTYSTLPYAVQYWAGLAVTNPHIRIREETRALSQRGRYMLAELNDGTQGDIARHTFEQIADYIEGQL